MQKQASNSVGRPRREIWAREQTRVWAMAVTNALRDAGLSIDALKDDARPDLWSRYKQGSITPTNERVSRVEVVARGTSRYFHATAWELASNKEYSLRQLKTSLGFMTRTVSEYFEPAIQSPAAAEGRFWRRPAEIDPSEDADADTQDREDYLHEGHEFVQHIDHPTLGIDMLGAYLFLLREAELRQDARCYLDRLSWLPQVRAKARAHQTLASIGTAFWVHLIEPVSTVTFADLRVQTYWQAQLAQYSPRAPLLKAVHAIWAAHGTLDEQFASELAFHVNQVD